MRQLVGERRTIHITLVNVMVCWHLQCVDSAEPRAVDAPLAFIRGSWGMALTKKRVRRRSFYSLPKQ